MGMVASRGSGRVLGIFFLDLSVGGTPTITERVNKISPLKTSPNSNIERDTIVATRNTISMDVSNMRSPIAKIIGNAIIA